MFFKITHSLLTILYSFLLNNITAALCIGVTFLAAVIVRPRSSRGNEVRIIWKSTPLINISYWSRELKDIGYSSEPYTTNFYSFFNSREDFDILLVEKFKSCPKIIIKPYLHLTGIVELPHVLVDGASIKGGTRCI